MGFLGFDSDRLGTLGHALERACADLLEAHVGADPAEAFAGVTSSIRSMTVWSQRIRSLIDNPSITTAALPAAPLGMIDLDPMLRLPAATGTQMRGRYAPGRIASGDLTDVLLFSRQEQGWATVTDPTPSVASTPDERSMADAALAGVVRSGDLSVWADGDNAEAFRAQVLAIAGDPARSSVFVGALGDQGLTILADAYAEHWYSAHPQGIGATVQRERATDDLDALATMIEHTMASPSALVPRALDTMDPEAAAMLLSRLDVDAATLGSYSAAILQRWHTDPPSGHGPWMVSTADTVIGPGSFLFAAMKDVPGAPASFVGSAVTMDEPMRLMVLYGSVHDGADYEAVMAQSTDPRYVSLSQARAILVTVIEDYRRPVPSSVSTDQRSVTTMLGAMAMPWLMELANIDPGFGVSDSEGVAMLRFVFSDEHARASIVAGADSIAGDAFDSDDPPKDWDAFVKRLDDVQTLEGIVDKLALTQQIEDDEKHDLGVTFWLTVSQKVIGYTLGAFTARAATSAINVAVSRAEALVAKVAPSAGPVAAIERSATNADDARNLQTYHLVQALYVAAAAYSAGDDPAASAALPDGPPAPPERGPGGSCSAKDYARTIDAWVAELPAGDFRTKMASIRYDTLNGYANGYDCA